MASSSYGNDKCLLPTCQRPRHRDAATGIVHDFCGRTHAAEYKAMHGEALARPHGVCHTCKLPGCNEPVYFDETEGPNGRVHEFCCRDHAQRAIEAELHPPSNRQLQGAHPSRRCSLSGCSAPRFQDPDTGELYDYCGRTHARTAAARGLRPPPAALGEPQHFGKTFKGRDAGFGCALCSSGPGGVCGTCAPDYTLSTLTNAHPKYSQIKAQFADSWAAAAGPKPTVMRVLQVRNPAPVFERYEAYKRSLAVAGRAVQEVRRFHATGMVCNFGVQQAQPPCDDEGCAVCSIGATSFKVHTRAAAFAFVHTPASPFACVRPRACP